MKAAKYLVVVYACGALATLGWMVLTTLEIAGCLESVESCITVVQTVAWIGLDWPIFWGLQLVEPLGDPLRVPAGLVPMGVLTCATAMAGVGLLKSGPKPVEPRAEEKQKTNVDRKKEEPYLALNSTGFAWFSDPGGRRDQTIR